jgi:signal peptidase I
LNENPKLNEQKDATRERMEALDWLYCLVFAVVIVILLCAFVARPIVVYGSSMVPTLEENNLVMINLLSGRYSRGDIVVVRKASFMETPIIKRVIATEGQTVEIDFVEGVVSVDGVVLDEPYVNSLTHDPEDYTEPVTVPEGCIFVMGDNRNRSTDSRSEAIGCLDERMVIGKVFLRVTPVNKFGGVK